MKRKLLILISLILFIMLTILVVNGNTIKIDNVIYYFVMKSECDFLTIFFKIISFLFSTIMIIIYCFLFLILFNNKKDALIISYVMLFKVFINNLIKIIIKRPRPSVYPMVIEKTYSFPSGHTTTCVVFIYLLYKAIKEKFNINKSILKIIYALMVILVGLSRIYLGVHYFSDIIGAILLGMIIILIYEIMGCEKDDK